MFRFGDSKSKKAASEQIRVCVTHTRQFELEMVLGRYDYLRETAARMPNFHPQSWFRLMTVATMVQNLMNIYARYQTEQPQDLNEFNKVVGYMREMIRDHAELGPGALQNMEELGTFVEAPANKDIFPRFGWGKWVVNNLKCELTSHPLDSHAPLNADERKVAEVIDDYITRPYHAY